MLANLWSFKEQSFDLAMLKIERLRKILPVRIVGRYIELHLIFMNLTDFCFLLFAVEK